MLRFGDVLFGLIVQFKSAYIYLVSLSAICVSVSSQEIIPSKFIVQSLYNDYYLGARMKCIFIIFLMADERGKVEKTSCIELGATLSQII